MGQAGRPRRGASPEGARRVSTDCRLGAFVTVAWQEARTRHFVCWSLQAFVNYLKGTVAVNTRTTGTRRNVGRQRAIVYVGNYAKSRMIVPLTGGPPVVTYTQYKMKQCNMKQYSVSLRSNTVQ